MRDEAMRYARRGWPVFPLPKGSKKPKKGSRGLKDASAQPRVIERWWHLDPDANIAMPTGKEAGVFVIDVDGAKGSASLTELENELGPLPETLEVQTGGGGRHLYFKWEAGREVRNKQALRPGIDVRGEGGYVVLPPSLHKSGRRYDWPTGDKGKIARLPKAWLDFIAPVVPKVAPWEVEPKQAKVEAPPAPTSDTQRDRLLHRARLYLAKCDPAIKGSGGHNDLFKAARALVVGFNLDDATAIELLWSEFNPRCQPPWRREVKSEAHDFERKVAQARTTPYGKPPGYLLDDLGLRDTSELEEIAQGMRLRAGLLKDQVTSYLENPQPIQIDESDEPGLPAQEERDPFPTDAFPEVVAKFIKDVAVAHNVCESYVGLPVLAVAGAAMGNAWRIDLKPGWIEPPILWVALVGLSGSNKSGPLSVVVDPLQRPVSIENIENAMLNPQGRSVVGNATLEAVLDRMESNPRGLLCFSDELKGWFDSFGAYKKASGGDESAWLSFWNGKSYQVDRKTNDLAMFLHAAACSVLGGIQPRLLMEACEPKRFANGLVPRLLVTCPPPRPRFWNDSGVTEDMTKQWAVIVDWLRTQPFAALDSNRGRYEPHVSGLTPHARLAFISYHDQLAAQQFEAKNENAKAFYSKAMSTLGRITLILHGLQRSIDGGNVLEVDVESAKAAVSLTQWCLAEQFRLYGFGVSKLTEESCAYLVDRIRAKGLKKLTTRQIQRLNQGRFKRVDDAREAMGQLVALGFAEWANEKQTEIEMLGD